MVVAILVVIALMTSTFVFGSWLILKSMHRILNALDTQQEQSAALASMLSRGLEAERLTALEYRIARQLRAAYDVEDFQAADELEGASRDALQLRLGSQSNGRSTDRR